MDWWIRFLTRMSRLKNRAIIETLWELGEYSADKVWWETDEGEKPTKQHVERVVRRLVLPDTGPGTRDPQP